jgi:predicted anti-sigma-YlaC factor YlaD
MDCKDYREQFTALLTDSINQKERTDIEHHLAGCADCRKEFEAAGKIWDLMGEMPQPEPSASMNLAFEAILSNIKNEVSERRYPLREWLNRLREYWYLQAQPRLAFSLNRGLFIA